VLVVGMANNNIFHRCSDFWAGMGAPHLFFLSPVFRCNRKIVFVDGDVFMVIVDLTHPNAWISKRCKKSHVLQA
jgi:hypothetical protein